MSTVAEPTWKDLREKRAQCVRDFLYAEPGTVSYSADVLAARLFALGLRGQDLRAEVRLAEIERLRTRPPPPCYEGERHARSLSMLTQILKRKDN